MKSTNRQAFPFQLFDLVAADEDARLCRDIPEAQCNEQPRSFALQTASQALSKIGDSLADSKIVLPWLLGAVGAPLFLVGLLVPIRESLALIPQILIGGYIRKFAVRKWFWVLSSAIEGACILAMGLLAMFGVSGSLAGWLIIGLLIVFSCARGIASIAAKDTLGKTVSKGKRGKVSGYAATLSGIVACAVGAYFAFAPPGVRPDWLLYGLLIVAGITWFAAAAVYARIPELPGATEGARGITDLLAAQVKLLLQERELQKFLLARALMIATALVGPIYVTLAQNRTGQELSALGWLMLATGLASTLSASFWGAMSDSSSRATMALAAMIAGFLGFTVLAASYLLPAATTHIGFYAFVLFVLGIAHAGVRIGRKTHIVDLAGGDRKAEYVAVSNTIIGILLLMIGGLVSLLLSFGPEIAIAILSALALLGALTAHRLTHAQAAD